MATTKLKPGALRRMKLTGKGGSEPFLSIPKFVLDSPQWADLSGNEVKMLIEIARQYNGKNNGDLSYPRNMAVARMWKGNDTYVRMISALQEKNWLLLTKKGGGMVGCSLYAVTFYPMDASEKHPCAAEHKPSHLWKSTAPSNVIKITKARPKIGHNLTENRVMTSLMPENRSR